MISIAYGSHLITAVMRGARLVWTPEYIPPQPGGLTALFGAGQLSITAFGAVAAPSVVFGAERITIQA